MLYMKPERIDVRRHDDREKSGNLSDKQKNRSRHLETLAHAKAIIEKANEEARKVLDTDEVKALFLKETARELQRHVQTVELELDDPDSDDLDTLTQQLQKYTQMFGWKLTPEPPAARPRMQS